MKFFNLAILAAVLLHKDARGSRVQHDKNEIVRRLAPAGLWGIEDGELGLNDDDDSLATTSDGFHWAYFDHGNGQASGLGDLPKVGYTIYVNPGGANPAEPTDACWSVNGVPYQGTALETILSGPSAVDTGGYWRSQVQFKFKAGIEGESPIYSTSPDENDDIDTAKISFCIRFDLDLDSGESVNFSELAIVVTVNLDGTYSVNDALSTTPKGADEMSNAVNYGVVAHICGVPQPPDEIDAQGTTVSVCIYNDLNTPPGLAHLTDVTQLILARADDPTIQQEAISGGILQDATMVAKDCTKIDTLGSKYCQVDVMLMSKFFSPGDDSTLVDLSGVAELMLGRRRHMIEIVPALRGNRDLQQDTVEKEFSLQVEALAPQDSAATKIANVVSASWIWAAAGALML